MTNRVVTKSDADRQTVLPGSEAGIPPTQGGVEAKQRRMPLHLLSLQAAVRMLCELRLLDDASHSLPPLSEGERARLTSYAKDGF